MSEKLFQPYSCIRESMIQYLITKNYKSALLPVLESMTSLAKD